MHTRIDHSTAEESPSWNLHSGCSSVCATESHTIKNMENSIYFIQQGNFMLILTTNFLSKGCLWIKTEQRDQSSENNQHLPLCYLQKIQTLFPVCGVSVSLTASQAGDISGWWHPRLATSRLVTSHADDITGWWYHRLATSQVGDIPGWWHHRLATSQADDIPGWWYHRLATSQAGDITGLWHHRLLQCHQQFLPNACKI